MRKVKTTTLLQSTSLIFALIAVLPLLTFAYALQRLDAIRETEYQAALAFALAVALLGFGVFRSLMFRLSVLLQALNEATQQGSVATMAPTSARLPAIGVVQELQRLPELVEQLGQLWKAEAERYVGQAVLVSVKNSPVAIRGRLCQAADNGLMLERDGTREGITYRRVLSIEADTAAPVAS